VRAACLIAIVGCSDKREPPSEPPRAPLLLPDASTDLATVEAEAYVALTTKLGELVAANRTDCLTMARAINRLLDANKQTLARGAEARAAGRELPPAALGRIQQVLQKLAIDLDACVNDAAVQSAFARYRGDADVAAEVAAADAAKIVALVDEVAGVVKKHQHDCPKLAAGIERVIEANREVMRAAAAAEVAGKRMPPATQQLMLGKIQAVMPLMKKCTGDPAVVAAFGKLQLGRH
jgi:hypothetical protein